MNRAGPADKPHIRQRFLEVRRSLSIHEAEKLSRLMKKKLKKLNCFLEADTIHTYVSMEQQREVSTRSLIQDCLDLGKKVVVPKIREGSQMTHHPIQSLSELKQNSWGVLEPTTGESANPQELSLIVVPMVAADFEMNRIGYGKGFYDRFLKQAGAFRVGLCYNCTLSWNRLPVDTFDQQMNVVITESKIIQPSL